MGEEKQAGAPEESRFKTACVFCGSSIGKRQSYGDAALELGRELVLAVCCLLPEILYSLHGGIRSLSVFSFSIFTLSPCHVICKVSRSLDLVYGGGSVGLMGLVSREVHRGGRRVLGVVPKSLMSEEQIIGETVGEVQLVANMHQRKAEMARQSDCFIALPGGYGTLEELLEVITWAQLGIQDKPVGLLNVEGYYNGLLAFIDKAVDDGFIKPCERSIVVSAPSARELLQKLEDYVPLHSVAAAKASWEVEQVELNSALQSEIAR